MIWGFRFQILTVASEPKLQPLNPYWYEDDVPETGHVITDAERRQMHGCQALVCQAGQAAL